MTRPYLAFTYSQLSKFVPSPGSVNLAAAEQALAYLRGTYNEGITYCDPGKERRNKLTGWVDSEFATDPDSRKSMTGYTARLHRVRHYSTPNSIRHASTTKYAKTAVVSMAKASNTLHTFRSSA
jgi:hypothetical protein